MEDKITTPPTTDPVAPEEPVVIEQKSNGRLSVIDPRTNMKGFLLFILAAIIVLSGATFFASGGGSQNQKDNAPVASEKFNSVAPYAVAYGYWTGKDKSNIDTLNLTNGNIAQMAQLPFNIKKVTVTSPTALIFINNTDERDHGTEIASYDTVAKKITTLVSASDGFKIDDYVVSPNKKNIALWEVSVPANGDLSTGASRVYTAGLDNGKVKNQIYDEYLPFAAFAHYPVAITDSGQVFMDTFRPNVGAGWANGMSTASFTGSQKQNIPSMTSGTYSTQPQASSDGKYLAFAGYTGSQGETANGYRNSIISPNTVETLDLSTLERKTIVPQVTGNIYPQVTWDVPTGDIMYSVISKDNEKSGQYLYDLSTGASVSINKDGSALQKKGYFIVSSLGLNKFLAGQQSNTSSTFGNLGQKYGQLISELAIYDRTSNTLTPMATNTLFTQYISILPSSFFNPNLPLIAKARLGESNANSKNQLQLETFAIKPSLAPIRERLQSEEPTSTPVPTDKPTVTSGPAPKPQCNMYNLEQCNKILGTNFDANYFSSSYLRTQAMNDCLDSQDALHPESAGLCLDSPLYLYGPEGHGVKVSVNTQISNSNAPYSNGYKGKLTGDGGIKINNTTYASIDYDYQSAVRKLLPPSYGKTVKSSLVGQTVSEYGKKLGLNTKEINDIVADVKGKLNTEFVFVSFYDEKTSKAILPITFEPTPDVYRNVVFYLRQVEEPIVANTPKFEKYPSRTGFTAVEVSYILE